MNQVITYARLESMMNNPSLTACKLGTGYTPQSFCNAINGLLKQYIKDPQEIINKLTLYTEHGELEHIAIEAECGKIIMVNKQIFSAQINEHNPNAIIETVYVFETSELENMFKLAFPIKAFAHEGTQAELFRINMQCFLYKQELQNKLFCLPIDMDTEVIDMQELKYGEFKTKLKEKFLDPVIFKLFKYRYFQHRFNALIGEAFADPQDIVRVNILESDYRYQFNNLLKMFDM